MTTAEAPAEQRVQARPRAERDPWFPLLLALLVLALFHGLVALVEPAFWSGLYWDEHWYAAIAEGGYALPAGGFTEMSRLAFGPAWPLAVRGVMEATGLSFKPAGLLCAGLLLVATLYGLARLLRHCGLTGTPRRLGLACFALSPAAYVLPTAYSEALYVPLLAWLLVALVEGRLFVAAALAAVATATRSPALVLLPTLAVAAFLVRPGELRLGARAGRAAAATALAACGFGLWMLALQLDCGTPTGMFQAYLGWNPVHEPLAGRLLGAAGPTALWQAVTLEELRPSIAIGTVVFLAIPVVLILARDAQPRVLTLFGVLAWAGFLAASSSLHPVVFRNILRHGLTILPFWVAVPVLLARWGVPSRAVLVTVVLEALAFALLVSRFVEHRWVS